MPTTTNMVCFVAFPANRYKHFASQAYLLAASYRRLGLAGLCLTLTTLSGCASTNDIALTQAHLHRPVKVLLVQSPTTVPAKRLQAVFAPKSKKPLALSAPPLAQAVTHSQAQVRTDMQTALGKQANIVIVSPPPTATPLLKQLEAKSLTTPITPNEAKQLQASTGADAILRYGVTDYGLTPQTWRTGYITFEVVSTLAITALIASVGTSVAKGAAGAYLAQETVEETAEGYAGFWALNVVCRPVRIDAELIQPKPFAVVWHDNDTGLADVHLSRLYHKISVNERNRQLDQSTGYAVSDLVAELSHKLSGKTDFHLPAKLKWEIGF